MPAALQVQQQSKRRQEKRAAAAAAAAAAGAARGGQERFKPTVAPHFVDRTQVETSYLLETAQPALAPPPPLLLDTLLMPVQRDGALIDDVMSPVTTSTPSEFSSVTTWDSMSSHSLVSAPAMHSDDVGAAGDIIPQHCSRNLQLAEDILVQHPHQHPSSRAAEGAAAPLPVAEVGAHHVAGQSGQRSSSGSDAVDGAITTVILQNLPRNISRQDLLDALDASGFEGTYDYLHVMYSIPTGLCVGYAFINFKSVQFAQLFFESWQQSSYFCQPGWKHKKALAIAPAAVQGMDALLAQPSMKKLFKLKKAGFRPFIQL